MNYTFQFAAIWPYWPMIVEGALLTIELSAITMAIGLVIGVFMAGLKTSGITPLRWIAHVYIETIRNTPLLVQLFIVFFALPSIGLRFSADAAALTALCINLGAYTAEIVRAGIESVHKSQIEAGRSLGMNGWQVFRHVILFQAVRAIFPSLTSQFVLLLLATSIVSQIGAEELFHTAAFIDSRTFRSFEVYTVVTLSYIVLALGFRLIFAAIWQAFFVRRQRS